MEKCKFKKSGNERCCRITNGECQFLSNGYEDGHSCPIKNNFKDKEIKST